MKEKVKKLLWRWLLSGIKDGLSYQRIRPILSDDVYLPWSSSALSATAVATVLNDIVVNDRSTIVECGGGVSTICIGRLLQTLKDDRRHVYTIEHDEEWVTVLRSLLEDHGVTDRVSVVHAPLTDEPVSWSGKWYDVDRVCESIEGKSIDLLLVDGPPAYTEETEWSRYPAVPVLKEFLSTSCSVVLDDIDRKGERMITQKWEDELGVPFNILYNHGNIAMAQRGEAFTVV